MVAYRFKDRRSKKELLARIAELEGAAKWVINVVSGVSRYNSEPTWHEYTLAMDGLKEALSNGK